MYVSNRLEIVSFTPRYWRSAPDSAIHAAPIAMPASAMATLTLAGATPLRRCPATAAARPPSTSAPSPPITMRPACAGSATHSAVRTRGAARASVFCQENALAKAPW